MDWTDGYVSDIAYTTGFYRELAPTFLCFAARLQGQHAPDPDAPFAYAELGCGQGFGTNILAAAYPHGRFIGVDFNPAQIANARALAEEAGLDNVQFRHESFRDTADLPDGAVPALDFVALHGIYAWISEANRRAIVAIIDRWLKPGGLVYLSYNCMPGWAAMAPFQRLLVEHAERNPGRSDRQIGAGFDFVARLRAADMAYFANNPAVPKRIDAMKDKDQRYLAHEYLNGTWQPLFFTDVARELGAAKLAYVGSASLLENFDGLALPAKAREVVAAATDPVFRELLKDFALNQQFRRDIFVKGARPMTALEKQRVLLDLPFAALKTPAAMSFTFKTPLGEAAGQAEIYQPIAAALGAGRTNIRAIAAETGVDPTRLLQAFALLTASGQAHPAASGREAGPAQRLNRAVARRSLLGEPYRYLAAPGIANGLNAGDVDITALDALRGAETGQTGAMTPEALAQAIWARFAPVNRRLVKDGRPLESEAENLAELRERAQGVLDQQRPVWAALGLV